MKSPQLLADRITRLVNALEQGLYERGHVVRLCLLAALSGESVFLLGPPGIGKSLIARRLKYAFCNARAFEYLMTRFSTPEELFGPLSIRALKDQGRYQRLTEGYLPEAHIVFLDEIWKAGPAILNTLLTAVNERLFRNGDHEAVIPMRLLVTAANELPETESGLEALYDRMLIRLAMDKIQQKNHFQALLNHHNVPDKDLVPAALQINDEEYLHWQQQIDSVSLPESVFELLFMLRQQLDQLPAFSAVSDRRWKKALRLLKASAFFSGRQQINPLDIILLKDCLWYSPAEISPLELKIDELLTSHGWQQQQMIMQLSHIQQDHWQHYQQYADKQVFTVNSQKSWLHKRQHYTLPELPADKNLTLLLEKPLILHDIKTSHLLIKQQQLAQWLAHGGEIHGQLNSSGFAVLLDLAVNKQQQLLVRDISLQHSRLMLPGTQMPHYSAENQQLLADLLQQWHKQHQLFNQQQPCLFIPRDWLARIESSLQSVLQQIKQAQAC